MYHASVGRCLSPRGAGQLLADKVVSSLGTPGTVSDHLQSVREVVDSNGSTIAPSVYDSFGKLAVGTNPLLFGYTGRLLDADTGLQNNLNRWYDAKVGRWLSEDPLEYEAGDANLYRYVANKPLDQLDPSGCASAVVENAVGVALLMLWVGRGTKGMVPGGMLANYIENELWSVTGVPVPGLTYAIRTNTHVEQAVENQTGKIESVLAVQSPGRYGDEGTLSVLLGPESTVMEFVFSTSSLSWSYDATVSRDNNGRTCFSGEITWRFYDEVDANSFYDQYKKGGFKWNVPLLTKFINAYEALMDLGYDQVFGANYDVHTKWKTKIGKN